MYSERDVIAGREITTSYSRGGVRQPILSNLSVSIRRGSVTLFIGPSGSGKTTLLSVLGGLLTPDSGSVEVDGTNIYSLDLRARAAFRLARIGFIFQSFRLISSLTALDNVALPLELRGDSHAIARTRSNALLEELNLGPKVDAMPSTLSGGEQQRVAIARALIGEPAAILADEPTANLDHASGLAVANLLVTASRTRGCAVGIVTHDYRLKEIADDIHEIEDGVIRV